MTRFEYEPRMWHSEDKSLTFRMDRYGMTDITPGPNSKLIRFLRDRITLSQMNLLYPKK